jgi:hypothetical protein
MERKLKISLPPPDFVLISRHRNRIRLGWVSSVCMLCKAAYSNYLQATRWDNYLHIFDPRIHWFSLINSLVIVVFLCVMVSMILLRSVSRDVSLFVIAVCSIPSLIHF